jgi:pyruvate/2-oxoglutarate dehydrogenase complex dihydrolipoamide acyltransferase (E2) component
MAHSRSTVPDFTLRVRVDMEAVVALRAELKASAASEEPVPSLNDVIVKASAVAPRDHPRANSSSIDGEFEQSPTSLTSPSIEHPSSENQPMSGSGDPDAGRDKRRS